MVSKDWATGKGYKKKKSNGLWKNFKQSDEMRKYFRDYTAAKREHAIRYGGCYYYRCKNKGIPGATKFHGVLCEKHFFDIKSRLHFGNRSQSEYLRKLFFEIQKEKCYLSGRKLSIGPTLELDHIVPKSRGGKQNDITNVAWCDSEVNRIKFNLTNEEFTKLCTEVAIYQTLKDLEKNIKESIPLSIESQ